MARRLAMLLACALALLGAARAEAALCVVTDDIACLAGPEGEALLAGEGIEDVFAVREGSIYAAGRRGAYRLYDARGERLGEAEFAMVDDAGDCLIYRVGGLYGAMDERGRVLLDAAWTQLTPDGAGGWLALSTDPLDESPDAILRVDAEGEAVPTGAQTASGLSRLRSGRMPVMAPDGRFGSVDAGGRLVIPAIWRAMGPFEGGCAKAAGAAGVGLIDPDGEEIIPAVYDWLERGDGIIAALGADGVDVYSADGRTLRYRVAGQGLEAAVAGSCLLVRDGDATRLYDASGALLGTYGAAFGCAPGLDGQLIAFEGEWGSARAWLMDPDGRAASGRYQRILPLAGGRYAFVEMKGIEYYSEDLGRLQTSWDYDSARCGLMDGAGTVLLSAMYREIRALGADRLLLLGDAETALSDLDGRVLHTWTTAEGEAATGE